MQPDTCEALRATPATDPVELERIRARLRRLDTSSSGGEWTRRTLELIPAQPALRAARLAQLAGRELAPFKLDVLELKSLGLTESLEVGYRISPRGLALLAVLRAAAAGDAEPEP